MIAVVGWILLLNLSLHAAFAEVVVTDKAIVAIVAIVDNGSSTAGALNSTIT